MKTENIYRIILYRQQCNKVSFFFKLFYIGLLINYPLFVVQNRAKKSFLREKIGAYIPFSS